MKSRRKQRLCKYTAKNVRKPLQEINQNINRKCSLLSYSSLFNFANQSRGSKQGVDQSSIKSESKSKLKSNEKPIVITSILGNPKTYSSKNYSYASNATNLSRIKYGNRQFLKNRKANTKRKNVSFEANKSVLSYLDRIPVQKLEHDVKVEKTERKTKNLSETEEMSFEGFDFDETSSSIESLEFSLEDDSFNSTIRHTKSQEGQPENHNMTSTEVVLNDVEFHSKDSTLNTTSQERDSEVLPYEKENSLNPLSLERNKQSKVCKIVKLKAVEDNDVTVFVSEIIQDVLNICPSKNIIRNHKKSVQNNSNNLPRKLDLKWSKQSLSKGSDLTISHHEVQSNVVVAKPEKEEQHTDVLDIVNDVVEKASNAPLSKKRKHKCLFFSESLKQWETEVNKRPSVVIKKVITSFQRYKTPRDRLCILQRINLT